MPKIPTLAASPNFNALVCSEGLQKVMLMEDLNIHCFRALDYSSEKYSVQIRDEIKERWVSFNGGQSPAPITNERVYRRIRKEVEDKYRKLHRRHRAQTLLWLQSERTLDLLRTKGSAPASTENVSDPTLRRFVQTLHVDLFPEVEESASHLGPNEYFLVSQPKLVGDYGPPFYSIIAQHVPQQEAASTAETIFGINIDFWAAFIGVDKRLGHDLVFFMPEDRFYFFDLRSCCYVPTSEDKVRLALSQALQQRAWGQRTELASKILVDFRTKRVFDEIINKAKAIHAADSSFFNGPHAHPRQEYGRRPDGKDVVASFVEERIEVADDEVMSLADCLEQVGKACPLGRPRKEVVKAVNEAIRAIYKRGLRHDLELSDGRGACGWKGLRLRPNANSANNQVNGVRSIRESGLSVESGMPTIRGPDESVSLLN